MYESFGNLLLLALLFLITLWISTSCSIQQEDWTELSESLLTLLLWYQN
jgi:hypothetical protein